MSVGDGVTPADVKGDASEEIVKKRKDRSLAHKGHRNLLVRGVATLANAVLTALLVAVDSEKDLRVAIAVLQLLSSCTLIVQWRTGRPSMFLLRGLSSWLQATVLLYIGTCGWQWIDNFCLQEFPDSTSRDILRAMTICAGVRQCANGMSLFLHFRFPHRMFMGHGSEQLFWRGVIQATGVPINLVRAIVRLTSDVDEPVVVFVNLCRALVTVPMGAGSLFNQWWLTKAGFTGHPASDAFERLMNPEIDCPVERVRIRVISAKDLAKADWGSKSDPYCVCEVLGRTESTWRTKTIQNDLDPVWDDVQELVEYRRNDTLRFTVWDYDEENFCQSFFSCCREADDFLGNVDLESAAFHPDGFDGHLELQHEKRGKRKHASIKVVIEFLDEDRNSKASTAAAIGDKETCGENAAEQTQIRTFQV